ATPKSIPAASAGARREFGFGRDSLLRDLDQFQDESELALGVQIREPAVAPPAVPAAALQDGIAALLHLRDRLIEGRDEDADVVQSLPLALQMLVVDVRPFERLDQFHHGLAGV